MAAVAVWVWPVAQEWLLIGVATLALASFALLFVLQRAGRLADWCTLARAALLAATLLLAGTGAASATLLFALCAVALAADLLDGKIARRTGPTEHGAVLDMEADQLATLQLAVLAVATGVGAWALLLPAYRYAFVLLSWWRDLPAHDPKPKAGDNRRARLICAGTMVLQLLAVAPHVPLGIRQAGLAIAVAALAYSYGDDVVYLLRRQREASSR